jgi:hypothetical protein
MKRSIFALMIVPLAVGATTITGQVRVPRGTADSKVPVTVALQVGSESYNATGPGSCRHATRGSIYNVLAQQWSVEQSDGPRSLTLTMWRPLNGSGDMISLGINTAGGKRRHVYDCRDSRRWNEDRGHDQVRRVCGTGTGGGRLISLVTFKKERPAAADRFSPSAAERMTATCGRVPRAVRPPLRPCRHTRGTRRSSRRRT